MTQLIWIQFWQNIYLFSKIKYISNTYPCSFTPEYLPKRNGSISVQRLIYKYCNTFIYSNQKLETTQIFSSRSEGKYFGYIHGNTTTQQKKGMKYSNIYESQNKFAE